METSRNSRRNIELVLLILAAVPMFLLYAMYMVTSKSEVKLSSMATPIALFVAFTVAHIANRILAPAADPAILPIVFALSGIGITFVTRLAPTAAPNQIFCVGCCHDCNFGRYTRSRYPRTLQVHHRLYRSRFAPLAHGNRTGALGI